MALMLAASQATLALLVFVSGLGLPGTFVLLVNAALIIATIPLARRWSLPRRWLQIGWLMSLVLMVILLYGLGEDTALPPVSTSMWGGLLLTILLAAVGITLSFPIGVALALGRRSNLPVVRLLSTLYIELVRAVPLITILFMADLLLPLFLPGDISNSQIRDDMDGSRQVGQPRHIVHDPSWVRSPNMARRPRSCCAPSPLQASEAGPPRRTCRSARPTRRSDRCNRCDPAAHWIA